jgi:soluble lytic murein transglycosylase-like protein
VCAEQAVEFEDGRTIAVRAVEQRLELALLHLGEGGQLAVPRNRIANWGQLQLGPPPPVVEPPPNPPVPAPPEPWSAAAGEFAELIRLAAAQHDLDPVLLTAVAEVESAFDPRAISPKGALGLLQLMPQTAARFGVADPFDAQANVQGGAAYLSWLLDRFGGRADLALAGYNAGEGAVDRYRGVPPYRETQRYVEKVLRGVERLSAPPP